MRSGGQSTKIFNVCDVLVCPALRMRRVETADGGGWAVCRDNRLPGSSCVTRPKGGVVDGCSSSGGGGGRDTARAREASESEWMRRLTATLTKWVAGGQGSGTAFYR